MEKRRKKIVKTRNQNYYNKCSRKKKERREKKKENEEVGERVGIIKNKIEEKFSELKEISLQNKWTIMEQT